MNKIYIVFCFISALFFSVVSHAEYSGGGGGFGGSGGSGSWGNSDGFIGNGGSDGDSWGGDSRCAYYLGGVSSELFASPHAVCAGHNDSHYGQYYYVAGGGHGKCGTTKNTTYWSIRQKCTEPPTCSPNEEPISGKCVPKCAPDEFRNSNGVCLKELKCPQGYTKQGNNCVWQCPEGFKMLGGSCVVDEQPEDCDPTIQECTPEGEPVCNVCNALRQLKNSNQTIINNDNRVISLTETMVSIQNNTNNNINRVNTSITNTNNTLTTINESISNVITAIENANPAIDTSLIEQKLDTLIAKKIEVSAPDVDYTPIITAINDLTSDIAAAKYDDTEVLSRLDNLIAKDFDLSPITDNQDEQISLLEDIKRLLYPRNEAGDPALDLPEVEQNEVDLWGAIKGFDINQNIINATAECPADKEFTINFGIKTATFAIPMSPMCQYLSYLAPIFLMLAYFSGAMIILKSGE